MSYVSNLLSNQEPVFSVLKPFHEIALVSSETLLCNIVSVLISKKFIEQEYLELSNFVNTCDCEKLIEISES